MVIKQLWICLVACAALLSCKPEPPNGFQRQWQQYVGLFYQDGRIVDTGNANVSHSEGQGYGMLFAVKADDRRRFEQMWQWTKRTLGREDNLFSWRYRPCTSRDNKCIDDPNNASDGDILIAWALLRAHLQWGNEEYRADAMEILSAIKNKLIVERFNHTLLLPGGQGFVHGNTAIQINLSYWVFPALQNFSDISGDPLWEQLVESGYDLIASARFGRWNLPPNWLMVTPAGFSLENTVSPEYGFDACRIPLHMVWHGEVPNRAIEPFIRFWQQERVPATVNLLSGETAEYHYTPGMKAIASVAKALSGVDQHATAPDITPDLDYFSASLIMLSELARLDREADELL